MKLVWLMSAVLSSMVVFYCLIFDLKMDLLREHTEMRLGFPSIGIWSYPPKVKISLHVYDFKNLQKFLDGVDEKLVIKEIGPIVYHAQMRHTNIKLNKNSTLSYRKIRFDTIEFVEKESPPGVLNQTLTVPNYILLASAAKLHNSFAIVKSLFRIISLEETLVLKRTPYELLFNFTSPSLNKIAIFQSFGDNLGFVAEIIKNRMEYYNVNISSHNMDTFFKINFLNYQKTTIGYSPEDLDGECPISVVNASDCTLFPPFLDENNKLTIVNPVSCKPLPLEFKGERDYQGYSALHYEVKVDPLENCFRESQEIPLPEGFFDVSKCHFDIPNGFSPPHFYSTKYNWRDHYEGFAPDPEKHNTSLLIIEPNTGIPLYAHLSYQSNIPIPQLHGFRPGLSRFNGFMIPTFWYKFEVFQLSLPMKIVLKIIKIAKYIQMGLLSLAALLLTYSILEIVWSSKRKDGNNRAPTEVVFDINENKNLLKT